MARPEKPELLSTLFDTEGHTVERYPNNVLVVKRTAGGGALSSDEAKAVARWFWAKVGIQHPRPCNCGSCTQDTDSSL